jgi:ketosteroid isomerase-like protein
MAFNDPAEAHLAWAAAFNAQDLDGIMTLFEDDAVLVPQPGVVTAGDDARAATAQSLAMGLPINLTMRHVLTAGDLAPA